VTVPRRPRNGDKDERKLLMFGSRGAEALGCEHVIQTRYDQIRYVVQGARARARTGSVLIVISGYPSDAQKRRVIQIAEQHGYTVVGGHPASEEGPSRPARREPRTSTATEASEPGRRDYGLRSYPPVALRRPTIRHRIDPEEAPDE